MYSTATFPTSDLFAIKDTPGSGRGVFATKSIPLGTPILSTDLLPASVVYRNYKREVCAHCLAYDGSRNLKLRVSVTGHSFCGCDCLGKWKDYAGEEGIAGWVAAETFIKNNVRNGVREGDVYDELPDGGAVRPSESEIKEAWDGIAELATLVREARNGSRQKAHRKALRSVLSLQSYPDTLSFLLGCILSLEKTTTDIKKSPYWNTILDLVADPTPYSSPQDLGRNTRSYLHLLSILPLPLLPHLTPQICLTLSTRDSHNSFGIRSLDDNGSEMFGFGVWPLASYFNHSCAPNVGKRRVGRAWEFWANAEIGQGEELCISYMGGDERDLSVLQRKTRSAEIWGFVCQCVRCVEEDGEETDSVGSCGVD